MSKSMNIKLKNKDLVMLGIIIGIGLYFLGAMISNVFDASESNLLSYKVSGFLKLTGIGILTSSLVVGGIIIKKIDKNLRMMLLILGLVLLIIYTLGSPWLGWDISDFDFTPIGGLGSSSSESQVAYDERPTALGTPGFEMVFAIFAIAFVAIVTKIKRKNR